MECFWVPFIMTLVIKTVVAISRNKQSWLPYHEEDYIEQEPQQCSTTVKVIYDAQKEQEKREREAKKERERLQRQRELEIKNRHTVELAQMDLDYFTSEVERINAECAELEKELAEETAPSRREKLYRRISALNEKSYKMTRKRMIAYNILKEKGNPQP